MEVILKQDIHKIGKAGSIAKVKDGFARNFLFPKDLAVPLTQANLKVFEQEKQKKAQRQEKARNEAEELKSKLEALSLTIPVLAQEDEKLFGSLSAADIAGAIAEEGFTLDKDCVILQEPIKSLGIYEVPIKLHPDVAAKIKVWVVKK